MEQKTVQEWQLSKNSFFLSFWRQNFLPRKWLQIPVRTSPIPVLHHLRHRRSAHMTPIHLLSKFSRLLLLYMFSLHFIAYFIIMFGSLMRNVLVICVVIINRQMRTVTNYLIVNMAVADLLITAFSMPVTIKALVTSHIDDWSNGVFSDILCKIPFTQSLSTIWYFSTCCYRNESK